MVKHKKVTFSKDVQVIQDVKEFKIKCDICKKKYSPYRIYQHFKEIHKKGCYKDIVNIKKIELYHLFEKRNQIIDKNKIEGLIKKHMNVIEKEGDKEVRLEQIIHLFEDFKNYYK